MFDRAFQEGGSACAIRTLEKPTGIRVDRHLFVDFRGFEKLVEAVDGVEVRLREPIDGKTAGPKPPAGRVTPNGEQALGLVRTHKPFSDDSDTHRTHPRQGPLGTLVDKASGNDVAPNPAKSHPVPSAVAPALTTDPKPVNLRGLRELVRGLRGILAEHVQFPTAPGGRTRTTPTGTRLHGPPRRGRSSGCAGVHRSRSHRARCGVAARNPGPPSDREFGRHEHQE
ncbi:MULTISPECIES: LCP family protein [unclassified Streptomyces]|uniref:LCP family protein n=1 Tax=unclassified Streptomyces TaxID=2593676 RepID=UPI0013311FE7|nr:MULTISPECIES: LCP family protein [unclassified Streptomyces]MCP3768962.1 LCP family protein [Streptomyces sp. MAR25Y5]